MSNDDKLNVLNAAIADAIAQCLRPGFNGTFALSLVIEHGEIVQVRRTVDERLVEKLP